MGSDLQNMDGQTALGMCVERGELNSVKGMLLMKANVDDAGSTPVSSLHLAASKGHGEIVKALLARNADEMILDAEGRSWREVATGGALEVVSPQAKKANAPLNSDL